MIPFGFDKIGSKINDIINIQRLIGETNDLIIQYI